METAVDGTSAQASEPPERARWGGDAGGAFRAAVAVSPPHHPCGGGSLACALALWHAYYDQNQYFPMLLFEGQTGMPLGAWLRPGNAHGSWGAVDMLRRIVDRLRQHWPTVAIHVRGDNGVACPEMYDYCEAEGPKYAFGYANNEVLKRKLRENELQENARLL